MDTAGRNLLRGGIGAASIDAALINGHIFRLYESFTHAAASIDAALINGHYAEVQINEVAEQAASIDAALINGHGYVYGDHYVFNGRVDRRGLDQWTPDLQKFSDDLVEPRRSTRP